MTVGKTFDDYDLSVRAAKAVKHCGLETPALFIAEFKADFDAATAMFLRSPGCGRQTLDELLRTFEIEKPQSSKVRLAKFESEDELHQFIADEDGLNPDKLDANTLRLLLNLVHRGRVAADPNGRYRLTPLGKEETDAWHGLKRITMSITAPRAVLMDLIRALPDDYPYLSILEEELMRDIDCSDKPAIVLGG